MIPNSVACLYKRRLLNCPAHAYKTDAIQHPERVRFDPFFRRIDSGSNPLHHLLTEQVRGGLLFDHAVTGGRHDTATAMLQRQQ